MPTSRELTMEALHQLHSSGWQCVVYASTLLPDVLAPLTRAPWPQRQPLVLAHAVIPNEFDTVGTSPCGRWVAACE
jgi:hypothetical protein